MASFAFLFSLKVNNDASGHLIVVFCQLWSDAHSWSCVCEEHICMTFSLSLCSADGVALGAAAASSQVSVQLVVFFAVILHKVFVFFSLNYLY